LTDTNSDADQRLATTATPISAPPRDRRSTLTANILTLIYRYCEAVTLTDTIPHAIANTYCCHATLAPRESVIGLARGTCLETIGDIP
jgi:hypothetical protein